MKTSFASVEAFRDRRDPKYATKTGDCAGRFQFDYTSTTSLLVIVSDGKDWEGAGLCGIPFEHVSVSAWDMGLSGPKPRIPTWEEMAWVKDRFWDEEETVIQIHPPKSQYVNYNPSVLHLWKPIGFEIPLPPMMTIAPSLTL